MTAIVGILNKRSIALAADSAVTINSPSGHKVLNSANKVFSLSKKHPVGVMLYASASFMDTPWDIIIKMYRDQLNDKSHSTLNDYVADFVKYLKGKNFFVLKTCRNNTFCVIWNFTIMMLERLQLKIV